MKLSLLSNQEATLELTFYVDDLLEAINCTDLGEGSPLNPINFDVFVENKLTGLPKIEAGTDVTLKLSQATGSINATLIYAEIQNVTKDYNGYMDKKAWLRHFEWDESNTNVIVAPNGVLFVTPDESGLCQLKSKNSDQDIIISYGTVITFVYNNRICYGKIDPLIKVTSGGNQ